MAARRKKRRIHEDPSMASSSRDSTVVFVETNLGTRVVVPISADISAKEFKGELERAHLNCFPEYGSIRIDAVMVKQRSCYYYLSDSLPLKYAFQDSSVHWLLRVLVHMPSIDNQPDSFNSTNRDAVSESVELGCSPCGSEGDTNITKGQRKKSKVLTTLYRRASLLKMPVVFHLWRKRNWRGPIKSHIAKDIVTRAEAHRRKGCVERLSETVSVSGIIHKYFSDCDEVASSFTPVLGRQKEKPNRRSKDSKCCNIQPDLKGLPEVGKRVVLGSNNLGLTRSNEHPALSICKSNEKRSDKKLASIARTHVFEIPDESD